jgi:Tol biopolymer transport system component
VRPDGTGLQRLTFTGGTDARPVDDGMPTWCPDGSGIVFVSNRDGNLELYSLDLRTRKTARLTKTPQDETLPRVGPDGRFAFSSRCRRAGRRSRSRTPSSPDGASSRRATRWTGSRRTVP